MALSDAGTSRFVLIVGKIKQPPIVKHEENGAFSSVSVTVPLFSLGTGSSCVSQANLKLMIPLPSLPEIADCATTSSLDGLSWKILFCLVS